MALDNGAGVTYYGSTCAARATKRSAGFIARKARGKSVLECEECTACNSDVRYVGSIGRVLCHACVDGHHADLIGVTYVEFTTGAY